VLKWVADRQSHVLDFLLFLPTHSPGLKSVLNYYNSTARLTAEGDVHLSDEALSGLGMMSDFLKNSLFGAIIMLAWPSENSRKSQISTIYYEDDTNTSTTTLDYSTDTLHPEDVPYIEIIEDNDPHIPIKPARRKEPEPIRLTDFVPNVGYFAAGGLSGITSRTATAPLDRLKVYLIAQTGTNKSQEVLQAARSGAPLQATKRGISTLVIACKELWAAGGMRSLFAGIY
jgi:solute carrier family 25 phosphate transporter 23/24/25/41